MQRTQLHVLYFEAKRRARQFGQKVEKAVQDSQQYAIQGLVCTKSDDLRLPGTSRI